MGGDLVAGSRAIAKEVEEEGRFHAEREGMSEVLAENEKPSSGGPSSEAGSERDLKQYDSQIVKVRDRPAGEDDALSHLPEHEQAVLRKQLDVPAVSVSWLSLYRYATTWDKVIVGVSAFGAIGGGAVLPLMTVRLLAESAPPSRIRRLTSVQVIFGSLSGNLQGFTLGTVNPASFPSLIDGKVLYFIYLAIGEFVLIYVATVGFIYTGDHIAAKVREEYLKAILRQNIAYFDKLGAGEVTTRITADTNLVQDGISQKVGLTLTGVATFIAAFVIGFIRYWKLTLICSCTVVAIVAVMGNGSKFIVKFNKKSLAAYAVGGSVAEEVLSSIRTATAFGTQDKLARQYDTHLIEAEKWGFRLKATLGLMIGCM